MWSEKSSAAGITGISFNHHILKKANYLFVIIPVLFVFMPTGILLGQMSSGGVPSSSVYSLQDDDRNVIRVTGPDIGTIRNEDEKFPSPYRFAVILPVDISPGNSGKWDDIPDGGRIWRASVTAPGARALSAYFDKFVLPEGGRLFLYNPSKTQVIGAFTSRNNVDEGYFATELIAGDRFILEYFQPAGDRVAPLIHMYSIDYAYRGVGFLEPYLENEKISGTCEVNVK
jgi:hypothetical protein